MALMIASSVAWIVASKIGPKDQLGSTLIVAGAGGVLELSPYWRGCGEAPGFAVENDMKMSPEPSPDVPPTRPNPSVARLHNRSICVESRGAFVATTMMIDPMSTRFAP